MRLYDNKSGVNDASSQMVPEINAMGIFIEENRKKTKRPIP